MSNEHIIRCIICLEEEKKYVPNTKLFHVPCDCHLHIHSSCFRQCNSDKCIVCKKYYSEKKLTDSNKVIKKSDLSTSEKKLLKDDVILECALDVSNKMWKPERARDDKTDVYLQTKEERMGHLMDKSNTPKER